MRRHRFGFVLDQQVGLRTQAMNLEAVAGARPDLDTCFVPVRYEADAGPLARLPILPNGIRGTLRGVREIRDGLRGQKLDAVLWSTWAAKSVLDQVAAAPAVLVMDMTPTQMEEMGALYNYSKARARLGGGWKRRATERLYGVAHHLYPWSQFVADSLLGEWNVPKEKVTVVSPGVAIDRYQPDPTARPNDGIVRVLFVGGDLERKGGDLLLRWFAERRQKHSLELHLVTRDEPREPVADGVKIHHGLTNNSDAIVRLYQTCDVFALPTRADCYSLVALEAMASGLPVVTSRLGGIPDIVAEGETGTLIPPGDFEALDAALMPLICDADLRAGQGRAGRKRAEVQFDCKKTLGKLLDGMILAATSQNGRELPNG